MRRARDGFAAYLAPDVWANHRIAEWWARSDAELDEASREERGLSFDPTDLPPGQFVSAGEAWLKCRAGEAGWDGFGYPGVTGMGYEAQRVALDLAALNKVELTLRDRWGLLEKREDELTGDDWALPAIVALYEGEGRLRAPPTVAYRDERGTEVYPVPAGPR